MKKDSVNPLINLDFNEIYDILSGVHPRHEVPGQFTLEKLHRKYKIIKQILSDPIQTFRAWEKVIALEIGKVFGKDPAGIYPYHCNYSEDKFTDTENILISNIMNNFNNSYDWILIQSAPDRYGIKILRDLDASENIIHQYNVLFPYYNYPIYIADIKKLWSRNIEKQIDGIRSLFDSIANTSKYYLKTALKTNGAT